MNRDRYKTSIAFIDLLFNITIGLAMLFIIAFLLINPIAKKGDIIVTGPTPGVATGLTKDSSMPNSLCVVGKSLEDSDDSGIRLIEVAV